MNANMGVIGTGGRGRYLTDAPTPACAAQINLTAICDTFTGNLARGKDLVATKGGTAPKTYVDYKELLADKSIDAVIIATPEHLHYDMLSTPLAAGKHVYLEKPLAHTVEEAQEIREALGQTIASSRSAPRTAPTASTRWPHHDPAGPHRRVPLCPRLLVPQRAAQRRRRLALSYPSRCHAAEHRLEALPRPRRNRPFDKQRYFQWRLYWDYSNGIATDLMVHQTDVSAYVLGIAIPDEVIANGGIYRWTDAKDDREVPDTLSCLLDYKKEKMQINYSCYLGNAKQGYGEQFMGNEGTIEVISRQTLNFYPETYHGVPEHVKAAQGTVDHHPQQRPSCGGSPHPELARCRSRARKS